MDRAALIAAMQASVAAPPVAVTVPGWGTLYVKPPTVAEVDAASSATEPEDGKPRRFARAAARVICDADGVRLFDPASEEDVSLLAAQPWSMLQQVLAAVGASTEGN